MRTQADTWQRLTRLVGEISSVPPATLTPEVTLQGTLLLDSLDIADLAALIRLEFGVVASAESWRALRSLEAVRVFIEASAQVVSTDPRH